MRKVIGTVFCIIQTRNRRPITIDHDFPENLKTGFHTIQGIPQEGIVFRKILENFNSDLSDVAKGAFITDDNMANIRTGRPSWDIFYTRDTPIRENSFQTDDHVFDSSVKR